MIARLRDGRAWAWLLLGLSVPTLVVAILLMDAIMSLDISGRNRLPAAAAIGALTPPLLLASLALIRLNGGIFGPTLRAVAGISALGLIVAGLWFGLHALKMVHWWGWGASAAIPLLCLAFEKNP